MSLPKSPQESIFSPLARQMQVWMGRYLVSRLLRDARQARAVHQRTLRQILQRNRDTEFGRAHGFAHILNQSNLEAAYRQSVPLSTYADYEAMIERIKRGETNLMFAGPLLSFAATSGTTGRIKFIPMTQEHQNAAMRVMGMMDSAIGHDGFARSTRRQKGICLLSYPKLPSPAEGSVRVGGASALGMKRMQPMLEHLWTSPTDIYTVEDMDSMRYLHALYGLRCRSVEYIVATFAPYLLQWLRLLEERWDELVRDVENGTVTEHLSIPAELRAKLAAQLLPDPARAAELRQAAAPGFAGIVARLWPAIKYADTVTTGAFAIHQPALRYYLAEIPLYSCFYGTSEASIGVSMWPDQLGDYLLYLGAAYFEFIPLAEVDQPEPRCVGLEALVPGESYEVVATTYAGLYRYRIGDIVSVRRMEHQAPVLQVSHRQGVVMDLASEKITEPQVREAVTGLLPAWLDGSSILRDFTITADVSAGAPRYTVYLELLGREHLPRAASDVGQASVLLDQAFMAGNHLYHRCRERGVLRAPRVKLVSPGTFDSLYNHLIERNPYQNRTQIKIPLHLKDPGLLAVLEENTLADSTSHKK